jgi:hypothetical protein
VLASPGRQLRYWSSTDWAALQVQEERQQVAIELLEPFRQ